MCGICGTAGFSDKGLLKKMTDTLTHRGPDAEGFHEDSDVGLGVRRLRIIDLATGDQPIYNEDRSICVVLNGEIYNFKELREQLIERGHQFSTLADTEVIVHLYEEEGKDCVHKLEGMFAFAIWDKKEEELFIARDRLGIKPLYYTHQNNRFLFASEIKALLEDRNVSREINPAALDYFLTFLYIPAPLTVFKEINKLKAGHFLIFKNGKFYTERYWKLNISQEEQKAAGFYEEQIIHALQKTVKSHLVSDVPIGVFLSGGIDSSAIVSLMHQSGVDSIRTFSIGYEGKYSSYNELEYSRLIAERFSTKHQEFIIKPDIIQILPEVVNYIDEPFADSSALLTYLISKEASQHVKVALSGVGGDEAFGGYPRYSGAIISSYYERFPSSLRKLLRNFSSRIKPSPKGRDTPGRIKRFLESGLLSPEEKYMAWMTFFDSHMKNDIYNTDLRKKINEDEEYIHFKYFNEIDSQDYLNRIFYVDVNTYLPDDLLIMADRMSMAHSLELRVPFCDHKLMEFSFSIPFQLKLKGLRLKGLFKKSLKGLLPKEILNKPKQGFMVPLADWLREDLKGYALEVLSRDNIKKRNFFDPDRVQDILNKHFSGQEIYTHQIWALMVLEIWLRNSSL